MEHAGFEDKFNQLVGDALNTPAFKDEKLADALNVSDSVYVTKFKSFSDKPSIERFFDILDTNSLYAANPGDLNDIYFRK